ncbi:restriction endonuclease subunit S [Tenacibaculum finnmarkense]|uniref:restriction endonuclease subunit S n=1 Tax=Tenacibaculum finnmarkense TaxID=2781243 RepID=UPI00187B84A6|nr:restriction endonuclease subunit S [Tenacibaculum finnmarkense]MBE7692590.1 restriction endonuclease subunit S [Tenacibaculum finnmarkense genomovar finnmarkense]
MIEYKLKELLEIKNGRDYKHLKKGNIPVYGSGGLMRYVDEYLYKGKSVLLPRKGTLSNIQYVNEAFWTVDTIYYSIVDENKAEPYYLYNYVKLLDLKHLNTGTGVPSMTFGAYYDIPIKLPNLQTQKSIAKVLSDLDSKIAINNKINAALEAMAKTLYDYWFVQFDFPDKNGKPYKSSEGKMIFNEDLKREIPVGWEVKELASKADFKNGKGMKKELLSDIGKTPVFGSNGIVGKTEKSLFNNTVIAIGRVGANYGEIHYSIDPCWITDNAVTSQPKSEIYLWWLLLTLKTINYSNISGGSAQPLITQGKLKALQFPIPNSFLLDEFHKIANPNYIKINNILKQNQKLSELRDWLLPMLMNGQVSVGE